MGHSEPFLLFVFTFYSPAKYKWAKHCCIKRFKNRCLIQINLWSILGLVCSFFPPRSHRPILLLSVFVFFSPRSKRRGRPRKHPLPPRPSLPSPSSSSSSSTSSASSSSSGSSSSSSSENDEDEEDEEATGGAVEPCAAPRCLLPQQDTVQWIQCDVCDAWYHIDCLHVDRKKLLKDPNADFHCGCRWYERNRVSSLDFQATPFPLKCLFPSATQQTFHWRQAASHGHWAALLKHAVLFSYL